MRGRTRNKGPNPLTRAYESNGPDVKIRGTAQHIADKYAQLARDATASGDPVSAENYLQHAEHYYRLIAAAQETFRQQFGTQQRPFDDDGEEGDEDGQASGYGYQPGMPGQGGDDYGDGMPAQAYEGRQDPRHDPRPGPDRPQQQGRFDRNDRQDRGPDRGGDRPQRFDRNNGERFDRNNGERFDRNGGGRNQGGDRFDRGPNGGPSGQNGDRYDRQDRGDGQRERFGRGDGPRNEGPRNDGPRNDGPRGDGPRGDGSRGEGGRRDFGRNERGPGQGRPEQHQRFPQQDEAQEAPAAALPAFLTTPVRTPITVREDADAPDAIPAFAEEAAGTMNGAAEARPRRARRPRRPEGEAAEHSLALDEDKPAE